VCGHIFPHACPQALAQYEEGLVPKALEYKKNAEKLPEEDRCVRARARVFMSLTDADVCACARTRARVSNAGACA